MEKNRLEAFSDGVIAIIITIMVLELKVPEHHAAILEGDNHHTAGLNDLKELIPVFLSYVLSFIYVGIYWNNHHHLFQSTKRVTGGILWANLHLLFWLSLFPFATGWIGANYDHGHLAAAPTAVYGFVLLMAAIAYYILEHAIIRQQGKNSLLATAVGSRWKETISPICYLTSIPLAFISPWISTGLFVFVAVLWLVPDRRIERALTAHKES
jgi:uncharacterized membrane protein